MDRKQAEKNERALQQLLQLDDNKRCADCRQLGTRWASWNLGVFLCIRCGGLHRKLGTHISRVKSVALDTWTDEQVHSMSEKGNLKMNCLYNPLNRPPYADMEQYIRDKYEHKVFMNAEQRSDFLLPDSVKPRYRDMLKVMGEMGFRNQTQNLEALEHANGDINGAVEFLLSLGQDPIVESSESLEDQLEMMGFCNRDLNREAASRCGSLEDAINFVSTEPAKLEPGLESLKKNIMALYDTHPKNSRSKSG